MSPAPPVDAPAAPPSAPGRAPAAAAAPCWRGRDPLAWTQAAREIGHTLTDEDRCAVAGRQLALIARHTTLGTVFATVFAVWIALHLPEGVDARWIPAWIGAKVAVAVLRLALSLGIRRAGEAGPRRVWPCHVAMVGLLALDGLIWGFAGWRMAHEQPMLAALFGAVIASVGCVGTFALQVSSGAAAAYAVPMLVPTAVGLLERGGAIGRIGGPGELTVMVLLVGLAHAASRRSVVGMLLKRRTDALVAEKDAALALAHERSLERDRFLAKVSHELRTPLHGMLGLTRVLQRDGRHADPQLAHRLGLIEASGHHLLGLISDLLEVSTRHGGTFTLQREPFDLHRLVLQQAEVFALRAADQGLTFDARIALPAPCWVDGDASRLRQVISNLLSNAVKFTDHGGVTFEVEPATRTGHVRFVVRDTGRGIDAADHARIFLPFQQGSAVSVDTDGVGLGLTIAREIAQTMGDDIALQSQPGEGSTFVFEPPLQRLREAPPGAVEALRSGLPPDVLVVEDDAVNALIVAAFLDGLGVRHAHCVNGAEGVRHLTQHRPSLVLMDCRMPVMDGLSACRAIRDVERRRGWARTPVVALTATVTDAERRACRAAGMDDVLAKPFSPEGLAATLRQAWQAREKADVD